MLLFGIQTLKLVNKKKLPNFCDLEYRADVALLALQEVRLRINHTEITILLPADTQSIYHAA